MVLQHRGAYLQRIFFGEELLKKVVEIALKVPLLLKENLLAERAINCSKIASGIFLIKQKQFYFFEQLHLFDGCKFTKLTSTKSLTQETTLGILADVLQGGDELESLNIYHVDMKPANVLVDGVVNLFDVDALNNFLKDRNYIKENPFSRPTGKTSMYLGDLGG